MTYKYIILDILILLKLNIMKAFCLVGFLCLIVLYFSCNRAIENDISWKASGKGGAVAAGGKDAAKAGISVLEKGGNAADAVAATLLALSITDVGYFVIGAEVPLIIYNANNEEVKVLSGQGGAPLGSEAIEWYYKNDIPTDGGMKGAPVPGALSLCVTLLKEYGTMSFEEVVSPSLALLDNGDENWHPNLAKTFRKLTDTEKETKGTRKEKLQAARDRFYKGDIADSLVAFYTREGGFLRKEDLAAHVTHIEDPVKVDYRGYTIYKCGTWTQGPFLCQTLRLLEGFDLKGMGNLSADYIHVLSEAMKLGFADRDEYYGDPLFVDVPMKELLSDEYTRLRAPLIDIARASQAVRPGDPINMKAVIAPNYTQPSIGGTTTCVVADQWGNMVAATPSGNPPYSIDPGTGILHGNRLRQLNTTPGHPNRMEPGKRPRISLTPTMVLKNGKPVIAISVAGGDLQDQTTLICLLNFIEFNMLPEDAVLSPRFSTELYQDSFNPNPDRGELLEKYIGLSVEDEVGEGEIEVLKKRGHMVEVFSGANSHPVMLYVDPITSMMYVAGDHRVGRHAAALK